MKRLNLAILGVFAASLFALMPVAALAAHPDATTHANRAVYGTLKVYVAGSNAVVTTTTGDLPLALSARTQYIPNSSAAQAQGIVVGDAVAVTATEHKGSLLALSIRYDVAPFAVGRPELFFGQYYSSSATQFTLSHKVGPSLTFNYDANTIFIEDGQVVANPTFVVGETINVKAEEYTDGSMYAMVVHLHTPGPPNFRGFGGTYVSSTATQIVIHDGRSSMDTFNYDAKTVFVENHRAISNPTFTVGEKLTIWAKRIAKGDWYARYVVLHPVKAPVTHLQKLFGTYSAVTETTLTLTVGTSLDTFNWNANTVFIQHFHIVHNPTFQAGEKIAVLAVVNTSIPSMYAKIVWLYPAKPTT